MLLLFFMPDHLLLQVVSIVDSGRFWETSLVFLCHFHIRPLIVNFSYVSDPLPTLLCFHCVNSVIIMSQYSFHHYLIISLINDCIEVINKFVYIVRHRERK